MFAYPRDGLVVDRVKLQAGRNVQRLTSRLLMRWSCLTKTDVSGFRGIWPPGIDDVSPAVLRAGLVLMLELLACVRGALSSVVGWCMPGVNVCCVRRSLERAIEGMSDLWKCHKRMWG